MAYAGRLDPMAEGVLLLLSGADRHDLPAHLGHDKEYVARFLFGVRSDTHDALGRLTPGGGPAPEEADCARVVAALPGVHTLPLPVWSAYKLRGRPLHAWAAEGRLDEVVVPIRQMGVRGVAGVTSRSVRAGALAGEVVGRILRVRGAFRQEAALADWRALAAPLVEVTATLTVTSGTYVRSLAEKMGTELGCGCLLVGLCRTRVGPFTASRPSDRSAHDLRGEDRHDGEQEAHPAHGDDPLRGARFLDPHVGGEHHHDAQEGGAGLRVDPSAGSEDRHSLRVDQQERDAEDQREAAGDALHEHIPRQHEATNRGAVRGIPTRVNQSGIGGHPDAEEGHDDGDVEEEHVGVHGRSWASGRYPA